MEPLALPHYAGSLLRGQFGAALRNVACMTRQPTCPGCPLLQTCPYTRIFDAPPPPKGAHALQDFSQIPNAYVVEPPATSARMLSVDSKFAFHLVLIGHATEQLALVTFALQRALAKGLTRERVPADLLQVDWVDAAGTAHPVWTVQQPVLAAHAAVLTIPAPPVSTGFAPKNESHLIAETDTNTAEARVFTPENLHQSNADRITLHIHTPMRLQSQGKPLGVGQLTPRALIAAVARRTALLMDFHAGAPPAPNGHTSWGAAAQHITALANTLSDTQDLRWFDWTRFSSRQQREMTLGGVMGTWTLHAPATDSAHSDTLAQLWPWLWLGQWLHVGKNATMGLGGYTLTR
jgi:hypothetical protein